MAIGTSMADLEAAVNVYAANWLQCVQKNDHTLGPYTTLDTVDGDAKYYDRIGPVSVREKTQRIQEVEFTEAQTERRKITWREFYIAIPLPESDVLRHLKDPTSSYLANSVAAFNRKKDQLIINALGGTAYGGASGTTAFTLPAARLLASGASALDKTMIFNNAERAFNAKVGPQFGHGEKYWVVSSKQVQHILSITEFVNKDYAMAGRLEADPYKPFQWHGFTFIPLPVGNGDAAVDGDDSSDTNYTGLAKDGSSDRDTFIFTKDAVNMVLRKDVTVELEKRPDKVRLRQLILHGAFDAARMNEKLVWKQLVRE